MEATLVEIDATRAHVSRWPDPGAETGQGGETMARRVRGGSALLASVALVAACSSGPATGPVAGTVKEWQISLSATELSAGAITFNVKNDGDKSHEFVIRKTDLTSDKLPLNSDGEVQEDAPTLSEVGDPSELEEFDPGTTKSLTVTLQPGHYVIFCNLHVEDLLHYQKGMHVDFTVK
jgi:uncharacterized cupredoxin-like copper-binding protein